MSNILNWTSIKNPAHTHLDTKMHVEDLGFCQVELLLPALSSLKDNEEKENVK